MSFLLLLYATNVSAQSTLSIGTGGVLGLPDTVAFGDTVQGMSVFVINDGPLPVAGVLLDIIADPNNAGAPFNLGNLMIPTVSPLNPGDSVVVPLDMFIVTPSNSNQGSNVMVVWPSTPATQPGDTAETGYYVDPISSIAEGPQQRLDLQVYPNPTADMLRIRLNDPAVRIREVQIADAVGRLVYRASGLPESISLDRFPAGTYLVRFEVEGGRREARRIIKYD